MKGKAIPIFMLLIAYVIYLAHGIIPHHHHSASDHTHQHEHHHSEDHHHNDHQDNESLSDIFSLLLHAEDGFTYTCSNPVAKVSINQFDNLFSITHFDGRSAKTEIPPLILYSPPEKFSYCIYIAGFSGLRAPPFNIC